jgi:NAD-dependent dihydropyrimidine dehydrogenase PreA subunit
MPYFIADPCIDVMDKSCIEECPVDCIYEGDRKLYINPAECIDCGACEPVCPETAIFTDIKAPPEVEKFAADNEQFFAEPLPGRDQPVGNPGGSAKVGTVGTDTPLIQAWAASSTP